MASRRVICFMLLCLSLSLTLLACAPTSQRLDGPAPVPLRNPETGEMVIYDRPPEPVHMEAADFPEEARVAEAEGTVVCAVIVDSTGHPAHAFVLRSDTIRALEDAAIDAAMKWRFKPAILHGQPAPAEITVPFRWSKD